MIFDIEKSNFGTDIWPISRPNISSAQSNLELEQEFGLCKTILHIRLLITYIFYFRHYEKPVV